VNSRPRGFAFVEFQNAGAVAKALSLNYSVFRDRIIRVLPKRANPATNSTYRYQFYIEQFRVVILYLVYLALATVSTLIRALGQYSQHFIFFVTC
jgi:RNA recognition motif-containing protein